MLDPRGLYEIVGDVPEPDHHSVLVHALPGFIDAGSSARLATEHLLSTLDHELVVRFDHDQLVDYRARRPGMVFRNDRLEQYSEPSIAIHRVRDAVGSPFLLLCGPEPDLQWNRFVAAVEQLVLRFGVRLSIGLQAVPMAVPHTRPLAVTGHASRAELVREPSRWEGELHIPASIPTLIELRLGEAGYDAMGFAAHIPHYLSQLEFPEGARRLIESVSGAADLVLPSEELERAALVTARTVEDYVRGSEEVRRIVEALERQHDSISAGPDPLAGVDPEALPSGEELGAEFERFLAQLHDAQLQDGGPHDARPHAQDQVPESGPTDQDLTDRSITLDSDEEQPDRGEA